MRILEDIYRLTIRLSLTRMNCKPAFNLYSGTHLLICWQWVIIYSRKYRTWEE